MAKIETSVKTRRNHKIDLGPAVRALRLDKKLSGVELCRRAEDLDTRTLTAVEKGRIRNPSLKTLHSLARGLGISVSDIFRFAEMKIHSNFYLGTQKGVYQLTFQAIGCKIVSLTPFVKDFFCGKLIIAPGKRVDRTLLNHSGPMYVSNLVGQTEIQVEDKKVLLKEGGNLFFNAGFRHSFFNPLHRESVLLVITAPSFL